MATLTIVPSIDRSSCHARTNGSSRHRQPSHSAFYLKAVYLCLSANANVALVESYLRWEHLFNGFAWRRRVLRHQTSTILCANAYAQRHGACERNLGRRRFVQLVPAGGANNAKSSATILALLCWQCLSPSR